MITLPKHWNQNRIMLVSANAMLAFLLVVLGTTRILPLDPVNFIFFTFVVFLFALYRPGWTFLFLVGLIPFETVNLAPVAWGFDLRPYQWLSLLIFLAVVIRASLGKLPFSLTRPYWFDWLLLIVPVGAFLAASNAPDPHSALKQAFITLSFGIIYALGRIFWQSAADAKQALPFFLGSSLVVSLYALWQNLRFLAGQTSFEVMAGRPNATFSEADWLGLFIIVVLSVIYALMYQTLSSFDKEVNSQQSTVNRMLQSPKTYLIASLLIFVFIILIITVARSAWLGAGVGAIVFAGALLVSYGWRKALAFSGVIASAALVALILVLGLHLTPFDLSNRAESTASGLQEITVSCEQDSTLPILPMKIRDTNELAAYHCRHIMLEEIESEQTAGRFVSTVSRDDPNISIRSRIYMTVWDEIRQHPILGIGWGSIASVLGTDERGSGLNASNAFLEIWLGSGLAGVIAFSVCWFGSAFLCIRGLRSGIPLRQDMAGFLLSAWAGITVFNLFNSGILLGIVFLFLSLLALMPEKKSHERP